MANANLDLVTTDLGAPRIAGPRALGPELKAHVRAVITAALGDRGLALTPDDAVDPAVAAATIALAMEVVADELEHASGLSPGRLADLARSLRELVGAEQQLNAQALEERLRALTGVHAALARLRGLTRVDRVLTQGVRRLAEHADFDRVVLYRVDGGRVIAHCAEVHGDPAAAAQIVAERTEVPARGVMAEALRRRIPVLSGARRAGAESLLGSQLCGRDELSLLLDGGADAGFVLAPVAPAESTIALIYVDRAPTGRPVDALDRDTLWTFSEGFGYALERAALLERLHAQRESFRSLVATGEAVMTELCEAPVLVPRDGPVERLQSAGLARETQPGRDALLSPREHEVLTMMAEGARNRDIADRLCLSHDTVKSHVRRILRKLHATNRAEAVSKFVRLTRES